MLLFVSSRHGQPGGWTVGAVLTNVFFPELFPPPPFAFFTQKRCVFIVLLHYLALVDAQVPKYEILIKKRKHVQRVRIQCKFGDKGMM